MGGAARNPPSTAAVESQLERLLAGDRTALARLITAVESNSGHSAAIFRAIHPRLGRARVAGFTGPPGVGKSTLVNAVITTLRRQGATVGVVAVDPSSPLSGGAVLGDRVRMGEHDADDGVFVRSVASRGHLGGLSPTTARVVDLMDAAGRDWVLVETVGVGQSEVEVAELAPCRVVIVAPAQGDDVQAIKAGILEIADILVVNKGDQPLAAQTAHQLEAMLALRQGGRRTVPVLTTVATQGRGVDELVTEIESHLAGVDEKARQALALRRMRTAIARAAADRVLAGLTASTGPALDTLARAVLEGEIDLDEAAIRALELGNEG